MRTPSSSSSPFHDLNQQTSSSSSSSFFRRLVQRARLVLTDVTLAQLLTKEVTNGSRQMPDVRTMKCISRAAFEIDDYWRIVKVLHTRFANFDTKNWKKTYKALIVLEHLLTHGPKSSREEFESDRECIKQLCTFQYVDQWGYSCGQSVKEKAERVLKLMDNGSYLQEERDRVHKGVSRQIQNGNGSFNLSYPSTNVGVVKVSHHHGRSSNSSNDNYNEEHSHDQNNKVVLHGLKEGLKHDASETQEERSNQRSGDTAATVESKNDQKHADYNDEGDVALPAAFITKSWVVFD